MVLILSSALVGPVIFPAIPKEDYGAYIRALGIEPPRMEKGQGSGRLPQVFADMHGWDTMAAQVAEVYRTLTPGEQAKACVFGQNYGEAGAVERFGAELGLPPAISAHNSWFLWGPGGCTGEVLIVLGDHRERLSELFDEVELGATFDCRDCMPYEDQLPIWIARRPRQPLAPLWPTLKSYI